MIPVFIFQKVYNLLKDLTYLEKPISFSNKSSKELILSHVRFASFECRERSKFHEMIRQNDRNIKDFTLELQKQAATCNSGGLLDTQLVGRLTAGMNILNLGN